MKTLNQQLVRAMDNRAKSRLIHAPNSEETAVQKVISTIKSCITSEQLDTALKLCLNFYRKYGKVGAFDLLVAMKRKELYV